MCAVLATVVGLRHGVGESTIGYAGLVLAAVVSWIAVSGPGEAALIAAGVLAARHHADIGLVVALAWLGAMAGGTAGWFIGLKGGRPLVTAPGPLLRTRLRLAAAGDRFYERFGALAVFVTPSWLAGVNGMRARRFLLANAAAALVWALGIGLGAYALGPSVQEFAGDLGLYGAIGLVAVALVTALWRRNVIARRR